MTSKAAGDDLRKAVRAERAHATREAILAAAERLFAEDGIVAVSNRQVGEAAGQGNNTAVGYHFGAKADLVRAIARKHSAAVEEIRQRQLAGIGESADLRDWLDCLVRPLAEHLTSLRGPTWYARFAEQAMADPALRPIMLEESQSSPSLVRIVEGLRRHLPELSAEVTAERSEMTRMLVLHTTAERERALSANASTPRSSWHAAATGLVDALIGLWRAPVSAVPNGG